jgi:hypothetical protein
MNDNARKNLKNACSGLNQIKDELQQAVNNVENNSIRTRIEDQLQSIDRCLQECEGISSGLANQ